MLRYYLYVMNKLSGWDDTIVALATAPGIAAIGVIRLSGKDALGIIDMMMPNKKLSDKSSHTLHYGVLYNEKEKLDEVVVSLFRGPHSYTGEDVIEISCHGSPYIQQRVLETCIQLGARLAKAGEFTQRAFLKGKLDLTQAEAVGDLIASNTAASQRTALHNMRGGFSTALKKMREDLVQFAALIELELDFATEDVEFADRKKLYVLLEELEGETKKLLDSFSLGNVIRNGVSVAIIGKPNAGKSTLLNTLLNESRAIVSDIAGTTRDTIEETININGILFRLIDTAGIREAKDIIESLGVERSIEKMKSADLVLYVYDMHTETAAHVREQEEKFKELGLRYLLVVNKADDADLSGGNTISISAKFNKGIDRLKEKIFSLTVQNTAAAEDTIITNARHFAALKEVLSGIAEIRKGMNENRSGDLLSADIRQALYALGEITGEVTNEDKLDYIFSKFCIGK